MNYDELKNQFYSYKITGWGIVGELGDKESGQASVAEVMRTFDKEKGAFRLLKSSKEIDIKRFEREVKILTDQKFKHKNICNILEHSKVAGQHWYISQKGDSFRKYWKNVRKENEANPDKVVKLGIDIITKLIDGLIPLHDNKVVHRDIKPDNIVVVNGEPVLIDFGLVFHPDEERISPLDSAVGNARYSPDQMMNRMDEIPPWLDVFQLSQLFIWMVSERPSKSWSRPLDWRWVIYSNKISDSLMLSIRALTAICSDPNVSPGDASKLKQLIQNIFMETNDNEQDNSLVNGIKESIKTGKAKSVIASSSDLSIFNSSFPLFEKTLLTIKDHVASFGKLNEKDIPIEFVELDNLSSRIERIKSTQKFDGHQVIQLFSLYCGKKNEGHFFVTSAFVFYVPSQLMEKQGTDYLPDNFLPFAMDIGTGSNKNSFESKKKHLFVAVDKEGQIWHSKYASDFKTHKVKISLEELLKEISSWVEDNESWELVCQ